MTLYTYSTPVSGCTGVYRDPDGNATALAGPSVTDLLRPVLNESAPTLYCSGCDTGCVGQGETALDSYVVGTFTSSNMFSFAAKSVVRFGLPLEGYTNAYDRRQEQFKKIDDFVLKMYDELMDDGFSNNGITVRALNSALIGEYFNRILYRDIVWVFLAIVLVGVFVLVHTGSPLLTTFGMVHIILSFPFGYFFLQLFFDIGALGFLNFLTVFIILVSVIDEDCARAESFVTVTRSYARLHLCPAAQHLTHASLVNTVVCRVLVRTTSSSCSMRGDRVKTHSRHSQRVPAMPIARPTSESDCTGRTGERHGRCSSRP
jgi:hypothetical protein